MNFVSLKKKLLLWYFFYILTPNPTNTNINKLTLQMQHANVDFRAYRLEAVLDREVNVRKR